MTSAVYLLREGILTDLINDPPPVFRLAEYLEGAKAAVPSSTGSKEGRKGKDVKWADDITIFGEDM